MGKILPHVLDMLYFSIVYLLQCEESTSMHEFEPIYPPVNTIQISTVIAKTNKFSRNFRVRENLVCSDSNQYIFGNQASEAVSVSKDALI